jgi:tetratricopeptide (TPR) repeat protein
VVTATADHLRAAGSEEAAIWYRRAGDLSREVFANDEAAASYELALALGHPETSEIRLALGELAMARGDYETATQELRTAASHAEGSTLAVVEHRLGDLNRVLGRFELAEESYASAEGAHPQPAELYAAWALLRHRIGDTDAAIDFASQAEKAARASGDQRSLARALNILGVVSPDPAQAAEHIDDALALSNPNDPSRIAALNNKAHLLGSNGATADAIELVDEAIGIASRAGFRHHQAALLNHLADLEHQRGRDTEAEAALTEAVTLFADVVAGDWEPEVWLLREW